MIFKMWLINIILALCAVFIGKSAYSVWFNKEPLNLETPTPTEGKVRSVDKSPRTKVPATLLETAYNVIADRNLFSADRAENLPPEEPVQASDQPPKYVGRTVNLYGVIIMGNTRRALLDNPDQKPGEPRSKWVNVGDSLGNLTVIAIEPESVLVKEDLKKYSIPLYSKKLASQFVSGPNRGKSTSSPTIVNTETENKKQASVPKMERSGEKEKGRSDVGSKKPHDGSGDNTILNTPFGPFKKRSN